jgi:predicted RNase H-like HicB family nuclease
MKSVKIVIEHHDDGYIGYPLGFARGAIVGQGDTYSDALKDTESAIMFFIEHYGRDKFFEHLEGGDEMKEAYIAEAVIS